MEITVILQLPRDISSQHYKEASTRMVLSWLCSITDGVYPETPCGFRSSRSTIDKIFSLTHLQRKCPEQGRPLFLAFIDLTEAFDPFSRTNTFTLLRSTGCPPKLLAVITFFQNRDFCLLSVQVKWNLCWPSISCFHLTSNSTARTPIHVLL